MLKKVVVVKPAADTEQPTKWTPVNDMNPFSAFDAARFNHKQVNEMVLPHEGSSVVNGFYYRWRMLMPFGDANIAACKKAGRVAKRYSIFTKE